MTKYVQIREAEGVKPGGHYSLATVSNGLVFVAGQLPVKPGPDHSLAKQSFADQARQTLRNMEAVLKAANSSLDAVTKVTVYIVGIEHWPECNAVFAEIFGDSRPARSIVPVPELHYGYLIEVDAIAVAS